VPAIKYLQEFYAEGKGSVGETFYGRINRFFGALLQHYLFLLLLKDVCGRTLDMSVAQRELATFKKTTPSQIKELVTGNISFDDLECRFSKAFVEKNIGSNGIKIAFSRRKKEIYEIVCDLYDCMYWTRRYSGNDAMIRLCLDVFVLVVCKKISLSQAAQVRGLKRPFKV